ncbi:MAG: L-allo-threonine aldolase [Firmicutes bacterium]|nr:L-allo-threonine aldolase [candidate division NPL-UPA2 bacterium]
MKTIDLRSDTITTPCDKMREAMYRAEVGDDVYGEDPTVNSLEEKAAELLGKESALYVPSGTQGNLIALLTHCKRGDEVILEAESHIFMYEVGGMSALGGLIPRRVQGVRGALTPESVRANIRENDIHCPSTGLVCIENTHNRAGGTVISIAQTHDLRQVADHHGMPLHLDGARIFNASVALGRPVSELSTPCHSISLCLSKGLGAPVGSVLLGDSEFIVRARKVRKMLGGGMRQAGIVAAAGLFALTHNVERLSDDHRRAYRLALGLSDLKFELSLESVQTNIVMANTKRLGVSAPILQERLGAVGVKMLSMGPDTVRFVTHLHVTEQNIDEALARIRGVLS